MISALKQFQILVLLFIKQQASEQDRISCSVKNASMGDMWNKKTVKQSNVCIVQINGMVALTVALQEVPVNDVSKHIS